MISWTFSGVALVAALFATVLSDLRRSTLALWVAGLAVGGVYLTVGAELLAVVQWILSTIVAVSIIFFSVMFGENRGAAKEPVDRQSSGKRLLRGGMAAVVAVLLVLTFTVGLRGALGRHELGGDLAPIAGSDLAAVGKSLVENHLLSLEVLALALFLVLIGGGVLARPDGPVSGAEEKP